jgi:hypothetical protein
VIVVVVIVIVVVVVVVVVGVFQISTNVPSRQIPCA